MSKRFGWLLGVVGLVLIGLLVACGSSYNSSSDGLLLVGSQYSGLIETFSFNLNGGSVSAIGNTPQDTSNDVCVLNGTPTSIVIDPAGVYAYTVLYGTPCTTGPAGIQAFKINSDGTTSPVGSLVPFTAETVTECLPTNPPSASCTPTTTTEKVPAVPGVMVMDTAGKFLFVGDRATTDTNTPPLPVPGAISVFAIGSGGSLTEVTGSPFFTNYPATAMTLPQAGLDIVAVAPTPTVFPAIGINGVQNSVCSTPGLPAPTSEYLYAVDGLGYQVFEFEVNMTTGVLTPPPLMSNIPAIPTDKAPLGVAVDPCNRFVYVADSLTDKVSAYTICNGSVTQAATCMQPPDGSLVPVAGSPFSLAGSPINPGPLVVDPFGNYVYVLGTGSNTINLLKITPATGSLAALSPATVATGRGPISIVIRGDDNWLFVSNYGTGAGGGNSVSEYSVTPESGALTALPAIPTDNYPWGLAVK